MTTSGQVPDPDNQAVQSMLKEYSSTMGPAVNNGDNLWIPMAVEARIGFPKPSAPEINLNIYTTVMGSLAAATDHLARKKQFEVQSGLV